MCLGIPAKVIKVMGNTGEVEVGGVRRSVWFDLLDSVNEGDWVILHAGFAIQRLDEELAQETLRTIQEIL